MRINQIGANLSSKLYNKGDHKQLNVSGHEDRSRNRFHKSSAKISHIPERTQLIREHHKQTHAKFMTQCFR